MSSGCTCSGSAGASCGGCGGVSCYSSSSGGSSGCSNCSSSCTQNCQGVCSSLCTGASSKEIQNFVLHKKFLQSDMEQIIKYVKIECERRDFTPTRASFSKTEKIDNDKILEIINNLNKIEKTISINTNELTSNKKRATYSLGKSIIEKLKKANQAMVAGGSY